MRSVCTLLLLLIVLCLCASGQLSAQDYGRGFFRDEPTQCRLTPLVIANKGQFDESVRFTIPGPNGSVFFLKDSVVVVLSASDDPSADEPKKDYLSQLPPEVLEAAISRRRPISRPRVARIAGVSFADSNADVKIETIEEQQARANYLIGSDSTKWIKAVPTSKGVVYRDLWPGVSVVFKADAGRITCTVEGADADLSKLRGTDGASLSPDDVGKLLSEAVGGEWIARKGLRTMLEDGEVFTAGTVHMPRGKALGSPSDYVSDCFAVKAGYSGRISWITFIGGSSEDAVNAVCVDRHGYTYINGFTQSADFPTTDTAYKKEHNGHQDYFTAKLGPSGGSLAYSTYLGVGGGGLGLEPFAAKWAGPKGEKLLAIMIDDGREQAQIKPFLDLGIPMTFALMPWTDPVCIKQIKAAGSAVFLHAPMEALGSVNTRSEEIMVTQTEKQVMEMLEGWLALTPGVVGVSNHRGSAATSDPETMRRVAVFAKKHGLMMYDSNTAPVAIGVNVARDQKVPCLQQDFFLDEREASGVRNRMLAMAALAERTGYATCICHVGRSSVTDGIRSVIRELQAKGFRFVTVPQLYEALSGQ